MGTAGHIDHGKTALVKALTGIDADRLEEEKRRGITIDIGFAHLQLTPDLRLGFVDVPGHERFVKNMLAGVGGIDLVLFVVAADESIKPQTREHFEICRLLNVRRGITVLTKSDTVDAETLEVVRLEVEEFLRGSFLGPPTPIVSVSSLTGAGLEDLKRELAKAAAEVPAKDSRTLTRLPIDRVFTMKGFGTVVTLLAGLPMIRTSTGHGTAFDIAGKNVADHKNLLEAIRVAGEIATHRQGARAVHQLEVLPRPSESRAPNNPWPLWPNIFRVSTAHEEGGDRVYAVATQQFDGDQSGRVSALRAVRVETVSKDGRLEFKNVEGSEFEIKADLVSGNRLLSSITITPPTGRLDVGGSRGFSARLQHPGGKMPEVRLSFLP